MVKLRTKSVVKPWGRTDLPASFGGNGKRQIGEIWFEPPEGISLQLLVKYLFTSEKLSIQVHPNDRQARRAGYPHGKEECWLVLDAEPNAKLGIGLTKEVRHAKIMAAIACGQMESLIDWKTVSAGDFFHIPPGTIHAIGPGLTLLEIQQNIDLTYRLFDYGRPRELHLDDALKVASLKPFDMKNYVTVTPDQSAKLLEAAHFQVFQVIGNDHEVLRSLEASEWQVTPLEGSVKARGKLIKPGQCGIFTSHEEIDLSKNTRSIVAVTAG